MGQNLGRKFDPLFASYFFRRKRKKRPEIVRFQVFYGCGGRTRTCGLRVMSCSEPLIPCNARVSRIFYPRKSGKTRRPDEFAPHSTNELSRKWVGIWVSADEGVSRNGTLNQRRGFFPLHDPCLHQAFLCRMTSILSFTKRFRRNFLSDSF